MKIAKISFFFTLKRHLLSINSTSLNSFNLPIKKRKNLPLPLHQSHLLTSPYPAFFNFPGSHCQLPTPPPPPSASSTMADLPSRLSRRASASRATPYPAITATLFRRRKTPPLPPCYLAGKVEEEGERVSYQRRM